VTVAALGLGGNLGDRRANLAAAVNAVAEHPDVRLEAVSGLYETPPWGKTDQPAFLNAALRIETRLAPRTLLDAILDIERRLGRQRGERWGPRTVDIDVLLYGDAAIDEPGLRVPHPRLTERAFALAPLADVLPQATVAGRTVADWLAQADRSGMVRIAEPGWEGTAS
jgi:2-amino-4-hydroxy-6-hydroxymethyldihydropteridine diphosphokinase